MATRLFIPAMQIRHFALLTAVFLCQAALGIGYFVNETYKDAFGIGSVIIPIIGYALVAYRLQILRNIPKVSRVIVALGASGIVWYVGGCLITAAVIRMGLVKPR
jgi:hypothetical protein